MRTSHGLLAFLTTLGVFYPFVIELELHGRHYDARQRERDALHGENDRLVRTMMLRSSGRNATAATTVLRRSGGGRLPGETRDEATARRRDDGRPIADEHGNGTSWSPSPYAYAFVLGGCDPDVPTYRPYLYGVYVSSYILRKLGSTADIVLFVEMYHGSAHGGLPANELEVLRRLRVTVREIPRTTAQSFYRLQLNKFRILGLTRYRRVMFLDADVMPTANLDYLFESSDPAVRDPPVLQENFVVWGKYAPANGGTFMLAPHRGDLEKINSMIQRKEALQNLGNKFDKSIGWGHRIRWQSIYKSNVDGWHFYAAQGDQGLLYYWVMYVRRRVSVLTGSGEVETWGPVADSDAEVERKEVLSLPVFPGPRIEPVHCWDTCENGTVWSNFVHFYGPGKPWAKGMPSGMRKKGSDRHKFDSPVHYWFYVLMQINREYGAGIDVAKIKTNPREQQNHPGIPFKSGHQNGTLTNLLD